MADTERAPSNADAAPAINAPPPIPNVPSTVVTPSASPSPLIINKVSKEDKETPSSCQVSTPPSPRAPLPPFVPRYLREEIKTSAGQNQKQPLKVGLRVPKPKLPKPEPKPRRDGNPFNEGRWKEEEHQLFLEGIEKFGKKWTQIAGLVKTRSVVQVRTHAQKYYQRLEAAAKGILTREFRSPSTSTLKFLPEHAKRVEQIVKKSNPPMKMTLIDTGTPKKYAKKGNSSSVKSSKPRTKAKRTPTSTTKRTTPIATVTSTPTATVTWKKRKVIPFAIPSRGAASFPSEVVMCIVTPLPTRKPQVSSVPVTSNPKKRPVAATVTKKPAEPTPPPAYATGERKSKRQRKVLVKSSLGDLHSEWSRNWKPEEDRILKEATDKGIAFEDISEKLLPGRSRAACSSRYFNRLSTKPVPTHALMCGPKDVASVDEETKDLLCDEELLCMEDLDE